MVMDMDDLSSAYFDGHDALPHPDIYHQAPPEATVVHVSACLLYFDQIAIRNNHLQSVIEQLCEVKRHRIGASGFHAREPISSQAFSNVFRSASSAP
jgi:hypothetical protein